VKSEQEELRLLLRSRFPILVVETAEEQRFLQLIENLANLDEAARRWADGRTVAAN